MIPCRNTVLVFHEVLVIFLNHRKKRWFFCLVAKGVLHTHPLSVPTTKNSLFYVCRKKNYCLIKEFQGVPEDANSHGILGGGGTKSQGVPRTLCGAQGVPWFLGTPSDPPLALGLVSTYQRFSATFLPKSFTF